MIGIRTCCDFLFIQTKIRVLSNDHSPARFRNVKFWLLTSVIAKFWLVTFVVVKFWLLTGVAVNFWLLTGVAL